MDSEDEEFENEGWDEARAGDAVSVSRRTALGLGGRPPPVAAPEPQDESDASSADSGGSSDSAEEEPKVVQQVGHFDRLFALFPALFHAYTLTFRPFLTQPQHEPEPEPEPEQVCVYVKGVRGACRRCGLPEEHACHAAATNSEVTAYFERQDSSPPPPPIQQRASENDGHVSSGSSDLGAT